MRAFFANGMEKMHIPWAVEGLPTLLHLSLFLFFIGLAIFLFNIDEEVFISVVWWIGLFSIVYGMITLLPIIRHDSPYNSPLSTPAWFLYASIHHVTFKILASIMPSRFWNTQIRCIRLRDRYQGWMLGGMDKAAEETASERPSEIDIRILDWTVSTLGDDDSLKSFFEAIPGFFQSKLPKHLAKDFPREFYNKFVVALDRFLIRTWSSNFVDDSEKFRRLDISVDAISQFGVYQVFLVLYNILFKYWHEVPQTVQMGQTLARWCTSSDHQVARYAQATIARMFFFGVEERNDSWITLAAKVFGLPERDLRDNIAFGGDNVLLAIFIHVAPQFLQVHPIPFAYDYVVLEALAQFDIRNTLPRLQHDFCTLWNEIVQEAKKQEPHSAAVGVLYGIRHLYIALHQDTDAALTAFSASTDYFSSISRQPSSYPLCNIASHHPDVTISLLPPTSSNSPDASSHSPTDDGNTSSRQANIIEPLLSPNPTITYEIGAASYGPDMTPPTNPAHSSSRPADASPTTVVAAAPQGFTSTTSLSHPLEESKSQNSDIVASSSEPGTSQILFTASTHPPTPTLAPIPTSVQSTPSQSYDAGLISISNSSHFTPPSTGLPVPASHSTGSATLPRLRARGLMNTRNICFTNAVLQLLVNSPPFWNLFRELGYLTWQRRPGLPETGAGATPLADATVRFLKEFIVEEESPSTLQQTRPATGGTSGDDEEKKGDKVVDSFEPTYMYDAMKEKGQLKPLLVCSRATHRLPSIPDLCWPDVRRMANCKMRKNFSVSMLTP